MLSAPLLVSFLPLLPPAAAFVFPEDPVSNRCDAQSVNYDIIVNCSLPCEPLDRCPALSSAWRTRYTTGRTRHLLSDLRAAFCSFSSSGQPLYRCARPGNTVSRYLYNLPTPTLVC